MSGEISQLRIEKPSSFYKKERVPENTNLLRRLMITKHQPCPSAILRGGGRVNL